MLIAPLTLHTSRGLHAITAYHRLYSTGELERTPWVIVWLKPTDCNKKYFLHSSLHAHKHKRAHIRSARSAANEHTVSLRNRLLRTSTSPFPLSGAVLPCPCGGAGGRAPRGCRGWRSLWRVGCDGWWRHFLTRACALTTCRRPTGSSQSSEQRKKCNII